MMKQQDNRNDGEWIQLALYDPCGDDEPVTYVGKPKPKSQYYMSMFKTVILRFNEITASDFVLGVCPFFEQAYVRHPVDVSRYKSTKLRRNREWRKS